MKGPDELRQLIRQGWEMSDGPGQIALAEEVVRHADALGDRALSFDARMLATSAYHRGGEPAKSFVTFSWCLAEFDADPGARHPSDDRLLRWFFKYVVSSLPRFPEVPLARTAAVLDDMERRYRLGGHSMHAVYNLRWLLARHVGDEAGTDEWYARWCAAPRDENSDCAGCDPTERISHLVERGRDAEAVALAEPVLAGQLTCAEQPQSMLTELLLPYLRTGRLEEARHAHRRAYRAHRGNVANLVAVATHLTFCARSGNEVRGLEIVQRHVDWLDRAPSPYAAMEFAASAALVLGRLAAAGHGDLPVARRAHADRPAGDSTVAGLAAHLRELATGLAARFDARNGTGYQSGRIAARLVAEPLVDHLPLSAAARPPQPAPARPVAGRDAAGAAPGTAAPTRTSGIPASGPRIPPGASAEELLDLADRYDRTDRGADARAVRRVFDERYPAVDLPPLLRARRTDDRGGELADGRDLRGAEEAWRAAARGYREAGDELAAQVALGRLGALLCLTGRREEGGPLLAASSAYLVAHGAPARRAGARLRTGMVLAAAGDLVAALAALDQAATDAAEADEPHLAADVLLRRAYCLAELDRDEEFRAAARAALDRYLELGGDRLATAWLLYARAAQADGSEQALAALDAAVDAAPPGLGSLEPRLARARALYAAGRPDDAVPDFVEVVAVCTESGQAEGAAFTRMELARAYHDAGRPLEAAEAGEEAVGALTALGAQEAADRCRYLLSASYRELGEHDAALALLDQLAENLDGFDNLPGRGQVYEEAGELLYRLDRDALAGVRFHAAARAYGAAELRLEELRALRRRALALRWAGDLAAALDALADADAAAARLAPPAGSTAPAGEEPAGPREPATAERPAGPGSAGPGTGGPGPAGPPDAEPAVVWERAMLDYDAAKILIAADQPVRALDRLAQVPAALRSIEAFGEALLAELLRGEVLLRLDRPGAAEQVLRGVLTGLPRDAEPLPQAAWLLAEALARLGREEEAAALRAEYGLDAVDGI